MSLARYLSKLGALLNSDGKVPSGALASTLDLTGKTLTLPSGKMTLVATKRDYNTGSASTTNTTTGLDISIGSYTPTSSSGKIIVLMTTRTSYPNATTNNYYQIVAIKAVQSGTTLVNQNISPVFNSGGDSTFMGTATNFAEFSFSSNAAINIYTTIISDSGATISWMASNIYVMEFAL